MATGKVGLTVVLGVDPSEHSEFTFKWYLNHMHRPENKLHIIHVPEHTRDVSSDLQGARDHRCRQTDGGRAHGELPAVVLAARDRRCQVRAAARTRPVARDRQVRGAGGRWPHCHRQQGSRPTEEDIPGKCQRQRPPPLARTCLGVSEQGRHTVQPLAAHTGLLGHHHKMPTTFTTFLATSHPVHYTTLHS